MTAGDGNPTPKNPMGACLSNVLCLFLLVAGLTGIVRGCLGPYWTGMRARRSDPCRAAHLFAEEIRLDRKSAGSAVAELCQIESPCSVPELVGLLDLPPGSNVGEESRRAIWQALQRRTAHVPGPHPEYKPDDSLESRIREEGEW